MSNHPNEQLIRACRAAAEAFLAELDGEAVPMDAFGKDPEPMKYDPLKDQPPFAPDPKQSATEQQRQLAYVTYLGAIGRINAEEGRGATSQEVSEFAKKAGYSGGNAVNGWNSRVGSSRAIEVKDGLRFLNLDALGWIRKDADRLGIELVGDFAAVPPGE